MASHYATALRIANESSMEDLTDIVSMLMSQLSIKIRSGNTPANSVSAIAPRAPPATARAAATTSRAQVAAPCASEAISAPAFAPAPASASGPEAKAKAKKYRCRCKNVTKDARCTFPESQVDSGRCGNHKTQALEYDVELVM